MLFKSEIKNLRGYSGSLSTLTDRFHVISKVLLMWKPLQMFYTYLLRYDCAKTVQYILSLNQSSNFILYILKECIKQTTLSLNWEQSHCDFNWRNKISGDGFLKSNLHIEVTKNVSKRLFKCTAMSFDPSCSPLLRTFYENLFVLRLSHLNTA